MSVINVRVKNIRPKYANLQEWCADPANVYIGRPGVVFVNKIRYPPNNMCEFANPFKIPRDGSREDVIEKYEKYARDKIATDPIFARKVAGLRGKTLGCWCAPEGCHGDVLVHLANEAI